MNLRAAFEKFVAFDESRANQVWPSTGSARAENARLQPILAAVGELIAAAFTAEKCLDLMGYSGREDGEHKLSADLWECAMWERDKLTEALAQLRSQLEKK